MELLLKGNEYVDLLLLPPSYCAVNLVSLLYQKICHSPVPPSQELAGVASYIEQVPHQYVALSSLKVIT